MPIVLACPGCPTKLSAPDSAAGKQIRCPKCGAVAPVPMFIPAEEVPVVEAAVVSPRPKPVQAEEVEEERPTRKRRDDDDAAPPPKKKKRPRYAEDDDDYDHDHPRRRRAAGGGGGGKGPLVAVIVVGSLLLLAGIGLGVYLLTNKGSSSAKKTPLPPGWKEYSYPNDGFKAGFPKEPQVISMGGGFPMGGMGGMGGGFAGMTEVQQIESVSAYTTGAFAGQPDTGPTIAVTVARFRGKVPSSMRDQLGQVRSAQYGGMESRKVRWLGYDAAEMVMGGTVMRIVYTDRHMIIVQMSGPNGTRAKPEEEAAFFDNFELTK